VLDRQRDGDRRSRRDSGRAARHALRVVRALPRRRRVARGGDDPWLRAPGQMGFDACEPRNLPRLCRRPAATRLEPLERDDQHRGRPRGATAAAVILFRASFRPNGRTAQPAGRRARTARRGRFAIPQALRETAVRRLAEGPFPAHVFTTAESRLRVWPPSVDEWRAAREDPRRAGSSSRTACRERSARAANARSAGWPAVGSEPDRSGSAVRPAGCRLRAPARV
jgi:hypothetical protein